MHRPVKLNEEHVLSQLLFCRTRLQHRQVDARVGEFGKNHLQGTGLVRAQKERQRRLVARTPQKLGIDQATHQCESGLVLGVVLYRLRDHARAVQPSGKGIADARRGRIAGRHPRAFGR